MDSTRREFIKAGTAGILAAAGAPLLHADGGASRSLEIVIIGLNAYVFDANDPSVVRVGFMGAAHGQQGDAAPGVERPKMRARAAAKGKKPAQTFGAPANTETVIIMEGFRTRIDAQTTVPQTVQTPPARPSTDHPADVFKEADWRSMQWVPNVAWFAKKPKVAADWDKKVAGILELRGGSLEAGMPAHPVGQVAMWEFKDGTTTVWKQTMADRIVYRLPLSSPDVTLHQTPLAGGAANTVKLRAEPQLRIVIDYLDNSPDSGYPVGTKLEHFAAFYSLLDDPSQSPILPEHTADVAKPRTRRSRPGPYCPSTIMQI